MFNPDIDTQSSSEARYQSYNAMVNEFRDSVENLSNVCRTLRMRKYGDILVKTADHLKQRIFKVGIMGEIVRGKSTVINALLGEKVVPTDVEPCTAVFNTIRYDINKHAVINYKDGHQEKVSIEELSDYITLASEKSDAVQDAVVYYPCAFCKNGIEIIDTPGLNNDERMNKIAMEVLPTLDVVIMVLVPEAPFGEAEAEFIRKMSMTDGPGRIIFVVNQIDTLDEKDRLYVLDNIRNRIIYHIFKKAEDMYTKDSPEYQNVLEKIGSPEKIHLYPLSARNALKGKINKDPEKVEESGQNVFEEALSKVLAEKRDLPELLSPIKSVTIRSMIAASLNASVLDADDAIQKAEVEKAEKVLAARSRAKEAMKKSADKLYNDLLPDVKKVYENLIKRVYEWMLTGKYHNSKGLRQEVEKITTDEMEKIFMKVKDRMENEQKSEFHPPCISLGVLPPAYGLLIFGVNKEVVLTELSIMIHDARNNGIVEKWLAGLIRQSYEKLSDRLDTEIRNLIDSMNTAAATIKRELQKNEEERERFVKDMQ